MDEKVKEAIERARKEIEQQEKNELKRLKEKYPN